MRRLSFMLTLTLVLASLFVPQAASAQAGCGLGGGRVNWIDSNENSRRISAELGWDGRLRARATAVGPWEKFTFVCLDGANDIYAIKSVANGRYVSAELGWGGNDYGMLRARATSIGPWERFRVRSTGGGSSITWTIQSMANSRYVSAEVGWTGDRYGLLRARATAIGPWEQFVIVCCSSA